jgi:queuine/archaeosine tRNA-ribosyltransferase
MASFRVSTIGDDGYGRLGELEIPYGPVETPAMFPVINLIGGTTKDSGGIWRRIRENLIDADHLQGIMFQAMSFTDFRISPKNLNNFWRTKGFHERFEKLNSPVFIDSGGFKLMNSNTFGEAPQEGGEENEWGLYTNPKSILGLQMDFGADIIATLDYPIPPNIRDDEKVNRMNRSIDSAIECLQILDNPSSLAEDFPENERAANHLEERVTLGDTPGVYVALHGHDYETVSWYVANFLERMENLDIGSSFQGFAIGSLVPLRSSIDVLVDIVQGAKDAIPNGRADEIGLHVFGVGGKQVSLLALLGVDSFDCTSHVRTAQYRKYTHPENWKHYTLEALEDELREDGSFPCNLENCILCGPDGVDYQTLVDELNLDMSYDERQERKQNNENIKSDYYALLARHNFEVYNDELRQVREEILSGTLLDYVIEFAREHDQIKKGLKVAQLRDKSLRRDVEARRAWDLVPGPELSSDQWKLPEWDAGIDESTETRSVSLRHSPASFNVLSRDYEPPREADILLVIPCSQEKPYSESRTHSVLFDKLGSRTDHLHKVTISGMYGPVPREFEQEKPVLEYDYLLAKEDVEQIDLVTERVTQYLEKYGGKYDIIVGYATSPTYRQVIENAFESFGEGIVFPRDPDTLQLTEYFRNSNIQELIDFIDDALSQAST